MKSKRRQVPAHRRGPEPGRRHGWWIFTGLIILWLLWMTSRPGGAVAGLNLIPFAEHSRALNCLLNEQCPQQRRAFWLLLINVVGNVVVFVPLGLGLAGLGHRDRSWPTFGRALLGGFLLSLAIELMQLVIPGRATDVDDLIFNTLGTMLGALVFLALYQLIHSSRSKIVRRQTR